MADERIEILGRVPLFDGLPEKEIAAVANAAKERRYDTGDVIVGEGEGGIGFFVIAEGDRAGRGARRAPCHPRPRRIVRRGGAAGRGRPPHGAP